MKKRRIKKQILNFIMITGMLILLFLLYALLCDKNIKKSVCVEAGVSVNPGIFARSSSANVSYALTCPPFYPDKPGEYIVQIQEGIFKYDCNLKIIDNISPVGTPVNGEMPYGKNVTPYDFVTDIKDATDVQVSFVGTPNMYVLGNQQVCVSLTDEAGNESRIYSIFKVVPIEPEVIIEAGSSKITPESLVKCGTYGGSTLDFDTIDYDHVGNYQTYLTVDDYTYTCNISVVDTVAPSINANEFHTTVGLKRTPEFFADYVSDKTDLKYEMSVEPDYMNVGKTLVTYSVTDEAGNTTSKNMYVYVEEDTEPPVFVDTENFKVFRDENVAYRKFVNVEDNSNTDVAIDVDSSKVDVATVGDYPVVYTATDYKGNTSTKEVTVSVVERTYTDDDLYALIDKLLAQIITEDMDDTAKARAIYDWVKNNIEYTGTSDKHNFNKAAINGLLDFKGDCYTNTTICVACFTRLGIKAKVIKKDPIVTLFNHWWLIVKIDGYYYHIDTCPRTKDNPEMFLWTDSELKKYSAAHLETHNYDRSKYPAVKYR